MVEEFLAKANIGRCTWRHSQALSSKAAKTNKVSFGFMSAKLAKIPRGSANKLELLLLAIELEVVEPNPSNRPIRLILEQLKRSTNATASRFRASFQGVESSVEL